MRIKSLFIFLILLVSMFPLANATTDVVFDEVEVNGVNVTSGGSVVIDRGEDLDIKIELHSYTAYEDVRVKASVEGYEYGDIYDSTSIFDIKNTGIYVKNLHLDLPNDLESGDYSLNLEVKNAQGSKYMSGITLQVREARHSLNIQDIILRPSLNVEAGRTLGVEVRVENMGSRKEEDIKVSASIPQLGTATRAYLDELSHVELDSDDDETSNSVMIYLPIPADAITGEYTLKVDVEYDRGHEVVTGVTKVYVQGTDQTEGIETVISIDAVNKQVAQGKDVSYRLMLANLGDKEAMYSLGVIGTQNWADVSLDPGFVRVAPNGAGEFLLTLRTKDNAAVGEHQFTLRLLENNAPLRDINLSANVVEASTWLSAKNVLEAGFVVLVALLVILGLIVAYKKLGNKDEGSEPEPIMDNGQSYY